MINYYKKFSLENKTAFVFGGLGLIGKEISTAYAQLGANTIVLDIKQSDGAKFQKEMNSKNFNFSFEKFNCTDLDELDNNFAEIIKKYNSPDIFINCSYPYTNDWNNSSFEKIKFDSFRKNVDIHMNSYAWLAQLAAQEMMKNSDGGSIIQLGSTYGILGQDLTVYKGTNISENMTYSAIKGGITNLTRQMASFYGQYNIRINTISPGGLEGHVAGTSEGQDAIFINQYNDKVPLKRFGFAHEVASTAVFLASDAASYITGANIIVDGGWTII